MITCSEIYWLTRLNALDGFLCVCCIVSAILSIIYLFKDSDNKQKIARGALIAFFIFIGVDVFVPSQGEIAAIYLLPKIINNKDIPKIPVNLANLLNLKLKKWISKEIADPNF